MMQWRLSTGNDTGGESNAARMVIEETVQPCAFCRGKGEKPAGSKCSVCGGKGLVEIRPPAVRCALCKGRGEERPRGNVTCNACRGKGYVAVTPPIERCASCRGTGRQRGSRLACTTCRGAGVVTVQAHRTQTTAASSAGRLPRPAFALRIGQPPPTGNRRPAVLSPAVGRTPASAGAVAHDPAVLASELEILRLYARALLTGERIILSEASRRSPAYVKLLKGSLIKKGLLRPNGSRKFEITELGLEALRKRGGLEFVERPSSARGLESTREVQPGRSPAGAVRRPTGVVASSASRESGLRWTTVRGI